MTICPACILKVRKTPFKKDTPHGSMNFIYGQMKTWHNRCETGFITGQFTVLP
jgi:hypothetical protein